MQYILYPPAALRATINLPSSKSISNRALVMHALSGGKTLPSNLSVCDDTDVIVRALYGCSPADIAHAPATHTLPYEIDIKAAGTAMRFMTAFLAANGGQSTSEDGARGAMPTGEQHVITGTERMQQRPISVLVNALRQLGAEIEYTANEGFPPLRITGKQLDGGQLDIAGSVSSQYISALLLIAPTLRQGLRLHLTGNIISRPYIDMTLALMRDFGASAAWLSDDTIEVKPQPYGDRPFSVESDWSAASYWYELAAISQSPDTEIRLTGLCHNSLQGDAAIKYLFTMLGVKTSFDSAATAPSASDVPNSKASAALNSKASAALNSKASAALNSQPSTATLRCQPTATQAFLHYDFVGQPDMAQTVVVCCAMMDIPFRFKGLQTLKIKETDRIAALITEMRKLGYVLTEPANGELAWDGTRCPLQTAAPAIDTYDDHRMAMAFAPAALRFPGLRINNPQVVTKSYPTFWDDLRTIGFVIEEQE